MEMNKLIILLFFTLSSCKDIKEDYIEVDGKVLPRVYSGMSCDIGILLTSDRINIYDKDHNVIKCRSLKLTKSEYFNIKNHYQIKTLKEGQIK